MIMKKKIKVLNFILFCIQEEVLEDKAAAQEMIEKSGQTGVPVLDIDGEIVIGFDRNKIIELLDII